VRDAFCRSKESQKRESRRLGIAITIFAALIGSAAVGSFFYVQHAFVIQRRATQAQVDELERRLNLAKNTIEAVGTGAADRIANTGLKPPAAHSVLDDLERSIDKFVSAAGNESDLRRKQGVILMHFADAYLRLGDLAGAVESARKATKIFRAAAEQRPNEHEFQSDVGLSLEKLGETLRASGDIGGSLAAYRESAEIAHAISMNDPTNVQWQIDFVLALWRLAAMGDQPQERLIQASKILHHLKLAGELTEEQQEWIREIELELLKLH
jgi:Flp pilus assembly protein TadD